MIASFEDSFRLLQRRTGDEIKHGKLSVKFYDEEGVDAGGVTREWFSVLARQMFNPGYALFQPQAADALTYQPNKVRFFSSPYGRCFETQCSFAVIEHQRRASQLFQVRWKDYREGAS